MEFSIYSALELVGALGFFIFGMKIMSEAIQKAAGDSLRKILKGMTQNRFLGVVTGFLVTAIIQSSSATTVMVVSFANAGLLTLIESISVIMGANIGTTLTAWLISIFGFKVKISSFALPIIAIGFPLIFVKNNRLKSIGEVFIGFALLFMGLAALKEAVPDLKNNPEVLNFLASYSQYGMLSTLLFVFVGTLLTVIVQSSSAAMALTLTLLYNGVIPFEVGAAMVMGENIGTTITANLAAMIGNVHAKRAARAHFIFNIFGVIWMVILFPFFIQFVKAMWEPFQSFLELFISDLDKGQEELQLSLFHTTFNLINVALMIGFVPQIARVVTKLVPSQTESDEEFSLKHIPGFVSTAEIGVAEAQKEIQEFSTLVNKMFKNTNKLLFEATPKKTDKLIAKIRKQEDVTDQLEMAISDFLTKISSGELSDIGAKKVRSMHRMVNDLERIGDIFYQMTVLLEKVKEHNIDFPEQIKLGLQELMSLVKSSLEIMDKNLNKDYSSIDMEEAYAQENRINAKRDELMNMHYQTLDTNKYTVREGTLFQEYVHIVEKVGDHVLNINEAIAGLK